MSERNDNLEVVLAGWVEARRRNDVDAIGRCLHPQVVWQGVRPDLVCGDRDAVLANVRGANGWKPDVSGIELVADGDQVLLGVHSDDLVEIQGAPLDGCIYQLFTIADGLIVRMDEYRTREEATAAMAARAPQEAAEPLERRPPAAVDGLIPFVHVADVARSIAFYELLGFTVAGTHPERGPPGWAAFEHGDARLMLECADAPVISEAQAVLFYLYTTDLAGLQAHLRRHDHRAGPIRDGSPGPREEMRVRDPDGYVLMIATREEEATP